MNNYTDWTGDISNYLRDWLGAFTEYLPDILAAAALLLLGWIVAKLLSAGAIRFAQLLRQAILRIAKRPPAPALAPPWGRILGSLVFWVVILLFVTMATQALGLVAFSDWLNRVVTHLPTLFVGVLIMLAGFLVSALARDLVIATAPLDDHQRLLLGRAVQFVILITAIVIGADQIGINVTFLVILAAVILGTFLGGVALAVSLGAKTFVANLIGAQSVRTQYQVGQVIRVGEYQGRILALTPTAVVLETAEGRVSLPAKYFSEQPTLLLMGRDTHG